LVSIHNLEYKLDIVHRELKDCRVTGKRKLTPQSFPSPAGPYLSAKSPELKRGVKSQFKISPASPQEPLSAARGVALLENPCH